MLRLIVPVLAVLGSAALARADLPQRAGWPVKMDVGTSGGYLLAPMEGVAVVDLDGDKRLEVVRAAGSQLFAWDADGKPLAGWPVTLSGSGQPPPSVGDLDGDGRPEIIQPARGLLYSDTSHLHVFKADGKTLTGWPISIPNLVFRAVSIADLDGNGGQDVVLQIGKWPPAGTLRVLKGDGTLLAESWEHPLDSYPVAPAAVGDLDGDGELEVVLITLGQLMVRRSTGEPASGFPRPADSSQKYGGGVLLVDLDPGRPGLEIVTATLTSGGTARLLVVGGDGKALPGFPAILATTASGLTPITAGDLEGKGKLQVVIGLQGVGIKVVSADGTSADPITPLAELSASLQLIDVDGDGALEILADNNSWDPETGAGFIEAYNVDGTPAEGFPLRPPGSTMASGINLADLDGDGAPELIGVSTVNADPPEAYVSVWTLPKARLASKSWPEYGHDGRRSNCPGCAQSSIPWRRDTSVPVEAGVEAGAADAGLDSGPPLLESPSQGCGCRTGAPADGPGEALVLVLALALLGGLLLIRPRRR